MQEQKGIEQKGGKEAPTLPRWRRGEDGRGGGGGRGGGKSTISLNWQKQQSYLLHMRLICKKRNANGRSARRKIEN